MSETAVTLDIKTLELLVEAAARRAVRDIKGELTQEIRDAVAASITSHFGEMKGSEHVVQHDRVSRLIKMIDRLSENFIGKVIGNLVIGLVLATIVGYLAWFKFKTFFLGGD
jgi:hypothetical protein